MTHAQSIGIITSASINGQKDFNNALAKAVGAYMRSHPKEFNDEESSPPEEVEEVRPTEVDGKSAQQTAVVSQGGHSAYRAPSSFWSDPFDAAHLPITILAISNIALMLTILCMWLFGGSRRSRVIMSSDREAEAIERLRALEASWSQLRKCLDSLAKA